MMGHELTAVSGHLLPCIPFSITAISRCVSIPRSYNRKSGLSFKKKRKSGLIYIRAVMRIYTIRISTEICMMCHADLQELIYGLNQSDLYTFFVDEGGGFGAPDFVDEGGGFGAPDFVDEGGGFGAPDFDCFVVDRAGLADGAG